jgi:acetyl esterase/lipase
MGIGMTLHRMAPPRPPPPSFHRSVRATVSPRKGRFNLQFYVPKDYCVHKKQKDKRYPVVVNFHGGGFTLGTAHDDARWSWTVVDEVDAVVVSVDYRLAPEHPFPTAVEDGVDAILYLARHADELLLDVDRIAVSGFSSGGNMSFTVPLRLQGEMLESLSPSTTVSTAAAAAAVAAASPTTNFLAPPCSSGLAVAHSNATSRLSLLSTTQKDGTTVDISSGGRELKLRGLVAFYPSTDYTQTREQRRQTCARADQQLPAAFTELFDESYLQPPTLDRANPFLSPGVAPAHMLAALPDDIVMFTCEWDMLLAEGERLRDRLRDEMGKNVSYHMVPGVPHGWDKAPNPLRETPGVREHYLTACRELKRMLA